MALFALTALAGCLEGECSDYHPTPVLLTSGTYVGALTSSQLTGGDPSTFPAAAAGDGGVVLVVDRAAARLSRGPIIFNPRPAMAAETRNSSCRTYCRPDVLRSAPRWLQRLR